MAIVMTSLWRLPDKCVIFNRLYLLLVYDLSAFDFTVMANSFTNFNKSRFPNFVSYLRSKRITKSIIIKYDFNSG